MSKMTPSCKAFLANQRKRDAKAAILAANPQMSESDWTPTQWHEAIEAYWDERDGEAPLPYGGESEPEKRGASAAKAEREQDDGEDLIETYQLALDLGIQ